MAEVSKLAEGVERRVKGDCWLGGNVAEVKKRCSNHSVMTGVVSHHTFRKLGSCEEQFEELLRLK